MTKITQEEVESLIDKTSIRLNGQVDILLAEVMSKLTKEKITELLKKEQKKLTEGIERTKPSVSIALTRYKVALEHLIELQIRLIEVQQQLLDRGQKDEGTN